MNLKDLYVTPTLFVYFKTAKGSMYTFEPGNKTRRNKAARADHPGDFGLKKPSDLTVFLTNQDINNLDNGSNSKMKRILVENASVLSQLSFNEKAGKHGYDAKNIKYTKDLKIGLYPLELWYEKNEIIGVANASLRNVYGNFHPGNEIVEIIFSKNKLPL